MGIFSKAGNRPFILFLIFLFLLFASTPSNYHYRPDYLYDPTAGFAANLELSAKTGSLTNNTRFAGSIIGFSVATCVEFVTNIFKTPNKNYFNPASTDLSPSNEFMDPIQQSALVFYLSTVVNRLVLLLPVFFVGLLLFEGLLSASTFYGLIFLILTGYGVFQNWLATDVFLSIKADQWHPFWEFQRMQDPEQADFFAIGLLFVLALIMVLGKARNWALIILVTAVAQSAFEHLGFITGVSLAFFLLLAPNRFLRDRFLDSVKALSLCGVVSVAVVAAMVGLLMWYGHRVEVFAGGDGSVGLADLTETGESNRTNFRYLLYRAAFYFSTAAAFGLVVGLFVSALKLFFGRNAVPLTVPIAFLSLYLGFMAAAALGFITGINYAAENGRELMPGAVMLACLSLFVADYVLLTTAAKWFPRRVPS